MNLINKILMTITSVLLFTACMMDDDLNLEYESYIPAQIDDGTIVSTPIDENIDPHALEIIYEDAYRSDDLWSLRSMLVYRNGNLVAESYMKSADDIYDKHLIWSCTKQVMGVLTGIAIEQGALEDLDDPISKYFDTELENHSDKASITIRNLLTMKSGIDFNNDGASGQTDKLLRQIPDNSVEFILDLPLSASPGEKFFYKDGDPHLLSALLQKVLNKPTDVWADEVLFSKIGVTNYNWVRYKDGVSFGGFGIETTPRELAKIALCVSKHGKWNNQQIVDSLWIEEMTKIQVPLNDGDYSFGYFWWIDNEKDIYLMWGHGGQLAFIIPEKDLVVVFTSIPNTQGDYQITAMEAMPFVNRIIDASN